MFDLVTKIVSIVLLDLILSGDNAVVIALATRKLDESKRKQAILIGTGGAILMRVVLMLVAIQLLAIPFVKLIGSLLLLYIAYDLIASNGEEEQEIEGKDSFMAAIRTIIIADLVMSLDNILAIAGVSADSKALAVFGLAISIPLIVFGSQVILKIMDRFPIVVWIGALLIAYTSGKMFIEDRFAVQTLNQFVPNLSHTIVIPLLFCLILVGVYFLMRRTKQAVRVKK